MIVFDPPGIKVLTSLYAETKNLRSKDVEIDMAKTEYFEADVCAAFGAILYDLKFRSNTVRLVNINEEVGQILSKNDFLSHYGGEAIPDFGKTTVAYKRFDVEDDHKFSEYIDKEFMRRPELPHMSPGLAKKFHQSIFEIFSNAVLHSRTKLGIFSCGQFFPMAERLIFTIADLGVGIRQNVKDYTGHDLSSAEAIIWATESDNTTKRGQTGGLGLTLLCEFIELNGGYIRIVSDDGYWEKKKSDVSTTTLSHPFPGTVVNLEIDTSDINSYGLASEVSTDDIF